MMPYSEVTYRAHVTHGLHKINSQAIGTVVPGWWEQADQVEIQGATSGFLNIKEY